MASYVDAERASKGPSPEPPLLACAIGSVRTPLLLVREFNLVLFIPPILRRRKRSPLIFGHRSCHPRPNRPSTLDRIARRLATSCIVDRGFLPGIVLSLKDLEKWSGCG